MKITITGAPGSGKTTIAKMLAKALNLKWYSIGDIRGQMAKEHGMTLEEFNQLGETEEFTDKEVDDYQTKLGQSQEDFIIDGRLSWYFIPESFKLFLDVSDTEGAKRVFGACQEKERDDENYQSIEETKERLGKRIASDLLRYKKYYGDVDHTDKTNFDLVIDTTNKTPDQILKLILDNYKEKTANS
ncbi:(d)CMP kinase [Patescibacteria group bacterium]